MNIINIGDSNFFFPEKNKLFFPEKIGFLLCILYDVIHGRKSESMHSVTKLYIEALS